MGQSIRVLSGNLLLGQADPDGLVDLIKRHEVDVFAAQELGFDQADAISSELPFGCLEPHESYMGMGIALRYPGEYQQIPLEFRPGRRAILDPKDWAGLSRPVDLVNIHIQAPHSLEPFPPTRVRHRQVVGLEDFFGKHPSDARVVVGDFNATPAWPVYRRLARQFSDGAVQSARREGRGAQPTWGRTPEGRRLLRIDHALVNGCVVENLRVVDIPGSDHSGLVFDCFPSATVAE